MGEFIGMEDWDLQAVVRGCSTTNDFTTTVTDHQSPISSFDPFGIENDDRDLLFSFPNLFETTSTVFGNELDELYKPFCPMFNTSPAAPQTISISVPKQVKKEPEVKIREKELPLSGSAIDSSTTSVHAAKYRRRKNQNKRVMLHVTAEGLSSDMWAWRKYGQKPIKGSPYPRSYYRCSSSKGCLARRQVEQSFSHPGKYNITYCAEHNHPQPTRRNSLAGINRQKFGTPKGPATTTGYPDMAKAKDSSCSPISKSTLSPTTTLISSIEEDVVQQKRRNEDDHEQMFEVSDDNGFVIPDMILSDDFFEGLEDLDGLTSHSSFYNQKIPMTFCS